MPPVWSGVDQSALEALHDEGDARAHADGVQAVGIAVEIDLQNGEGVENPQVGAAAGNGFIFRARQRRPFRPL